MNQASNSWLNKPVNLNSFASIGSAVLIAGVVPIVLMVAPVLVDALMSGYHFTGPQGGSIITTELGGMALATIPGLLWANRPIWRIMGLLSLVLMAVMYFLSAFSLTPETLPILRFISGLAGGTVMSVILATISQSNNPDRNFGWWLVSQLVIGAIGLAIIPRLMSNFGLQGYYIFMGLVSIALLIPALNLPIGSPNLGSNINSTKPSSSFKIMALAGITMLGILCFCIGLNGTWIFMGQIGAGVGLTEINVGDTLSTASLFGILGAVSATFLGGRVGRLLPILFGIGLLIAALMFMHNAHGVTPYAVAAFMFKYSWTFTFPYLLAALSTIDRTGKLLVIANIVIGGGMSIGPMISGNMLGSGSSYTAITVMAMTAMTAAGVFLLPILLRKKAAV